MAALTGEAARGKIGFAKRNFEIFFIQAIGFYFLRAFLRINLWNFRFGGAAGLF